jgi:hypothetical protein
VCAASASSGCCCHCCCLGTAAVRHGLRRRARSSKGGRRHRGGAAARSHCVFIGPLPCILSPAPKPGRNGVSRKITQGPRRRNCVTPERPWKACACVSLLPSRWRKKYLHFDRRKIWRCKVRFSGVPRVELHVKVIRSERKLLYVGFAVVLVYRGMNCKFFCISLYCDTANGYNLNPCNLQFIPRSTSTTFKI